MDRHSWKRVVNRIDSVAKDSFSHSSLVNNSIDCLV